MDLPSVLGGLAQGFKDFGTSVVDLFGTGGAAIGDLLQGTGTRNQDDFRKWLYNTNSVQDAAAKGLGTALNGVQTVSDYIPGIGAVTRNPLFNAAQGALGGLADEFKMNGENYDLGRAGQRAAVSGAAALAGSSLGDALKKSANPLLQSGLAQGLARGAAGGAINQGGYAAIDGGDIMQSALQGAGMGALLGGATGAIQDFRPSKVYEMPLTEKERTARIDNAKNMLDDAKYTIISATPGDGTDIVAANNRVMELRKYITALENGYDNARDYDAAMAKQAQDAASTATSEVAPGYKRLYRGLSQEYDPNYPVSKLDTSGYESWTDNPELARQYGKNVYYTDVPESDIKTSYMDENPQSETYGDRNLWHSITKPAGLNGISGTEYLLYMDDPASRSLTRNRLPGGETLDATLANADMAVNSPKLTPEQEVYFQNSVIRNSDGQLVPVYHSSPNKFTAFDDNMLGENTGYENTGYGHFVTPDKDFSTRFKGDDGNTMELYANVKKPITHPYMAGLKYEGKELDDIVEKWLKATGNSEVIDDLKLEAKANKTSLYDEYMSMMSNEDVFEYAPEERQALQNAGYDAIEILEGRRNQLVDGAKEETPVSSYAIFGSNQLKDINNLAPTSDMDIMASRIAPDEIDLERALAGQDMAVNSAKIAPGQLGLFDDLPTQAPKTTGRQKALFDQPQEDLDYYGSDIEMVARQNPYAPADNKVTQAMRDRANYIIDELALHRQIPENELYDKIDPKTLPKGHYETGKILDEAYSNGQTIRPLINNIVEEKFIDQFGDNPSKDSLISYLYGDGDADSKRMAVNSDIGIYMDPEKLHEETLKDLAKNRIKTDLYGEGIYALNDENRTVRGGYTGALDSALSERLGIAPGNTYKKIGAYDQGSGVAGRYARSRSHAGNENIMVGPAADNEKAMSTVGHERLHSFQAEAKEVPGRENRYSQEVRDAYNELAKDLKAAKAYKTGKEIQEWFGGDVAYWRHHDEQEARMFQQYLADNGYTGQQPKASNKVYHPLGSKEFDSAKINPAFDKFIDKLRDLSKRGVALPALAGLLGGGVVLDQVLNSKDSDKDKKKTKRSA